MGICMYVPCRRKFLRLKNFKVFSMRFCKLQISRKLDYHFIASYVHIYYNKEFIFEAAIKSTKTVKFIVLNV